MFTKLDDEVVSVLACPLCKGDLERGDEKFSCRGCGLTFAKKSVVGDRGGTEGVFDFRIHRPAYCTPAGHRSWTDGQCEYERWSEAKRSVDSEREYLDEIESVREVYTDQYHIEGRVLDVGGHQGRLRHFLRDDTSLYVSIDPYIGVFEAIDRQPNLMRAYPCLGEPCNFLAAHAEHLPFKAHSFDWIHMRSVVDHFADPYLALREAFRCCRPGGRLLIGLALLEKRGCGGSAGRRLWTRALEKIRKDGGRGLAKALLSKIAFSDQDHHTFRLSHDNLRDLLVRTGWSICKEHWQKAPFDYCIYMCGEAGKRPATGREPRRDLSVSAVER